MAFDTQFEIVLAEYHDRMDAEHELMRSLPLEEGMKRRDEFLLSVGQDAGIFLNMLSKSAKAKVVLEIGTSYGYSTLWLAEAAKETAGIVISLEIDADKANYAKEQLRRAGLDEFVDIRVGDALDSIRQLEEKPDFVLIDIWKELYVPSFELFFPLLKPGAYVLADNMIYPEVHKADAAAYRSAIRSTNAFDTVLLPIGSGIEVSQLTGGI